MEVEEGSDKITAGFSLSIVGRACLYDTQLTSSTMKQTTSKGVGEGGDGDTVGESTRMQAQEHEAYDDDDRGVLPIVHGILAETISLNEEDAFLPSRGRLAVEEEEEEKAKERGEAGVPLDPQASKRTEILSILTDALWPDVVQALRPLVERIVAVSKPLGAGLYAESEPVRKSPTNFPQENYVDDDW